MPAIVPSSIQLGYEEDGRPNVSLDGEVFASIDELQAARGLASDWGPYPALLARILVHLQRGDQELFTDREPAEAWWARWFEPPDLLERDALPLDIRLSAPDPERVRSPVFQGETLVFCTGRVIDVNHGAQTFEHRVDLSARPWSLQVADLPSVARSRAGGRVRALFGGDVAGFVSAAVGSGRFYLAIQPAEGASLLALQPENSPPERFSSWAELAARCPEATAPAAVARLADAMRSYPLRESGSAIADVAAYRAQYEREGYGREKLRYWVDQTRITDFEVDWDTLHDPRVEDGVVKTFVKGPDRQPYRFSMALAEMSRVGWPTKLESAHRSTLVYDSRGGPSLVSEPTPEAIRGPIDEE